jgi:hypothetical protein
VTRATRRRHRRRYVTRTRTRRTHPERVRRASKKVRDQETSYEYMYA